MSDAGPPAGSEDDCEAGALAGADAGAELPFEAAAGASSAPASAIRFWVMVTVMSASPLATAVTRPVSSTMATLSSLEA